MAWVIRGLALCGLAAMLAGCGDLVDHAEYAPDRSYSLSCRPSYIRGDLGTFWESEIVAPQALEPVRVGPVAMTDPALPVSLELAHDGSSLTEVLATTGSGGQYRFSAALATF